MTKKTFFLQNNHFCHFICSSIANWCFRFRYTVQYFIIQYLMMISHLVNLINFTGFYYGSLWPSSTVKYKYIFLPWLKRKTFECLYDIILRTADGNNAPSVVKCKTSEENSIYFLASRLRPYSRVYFGNDTTSMTHRCRYKEVENRTHVDCLQYSFCRLFQIFWNIVDNIGRNNI